MSKWISVDERLPETHVSDGYESSEWLLGSWRTPSSDCNCQLGVCIYQQGMDDDGEPWAFWYNDVMDECIAPTHWMPLPDPPQEARNE